MIIQLCRSVVEKLVWKAVDLDESWLGRMFRKIYPAQYGWVKSPQTTYLKLKSYNQETVNCKAVVLADKDNDTILLKDRKEYVVGVFDMVTGQIKGWLNNYVSHYFLKKHNILCLNKLLRFRKVKVVDKYDLTYMVNFEFNEDVFLHAPTNILATFEDHST